MMMKHALARRLRRLEHIRRLDEPVIDWAAAIEVAAMMELTIGGLSPDDPADTLDARWHRAGAHDHSIEPRDSEAALRRLAAWYDAEAVVAGWRCRTPAGTQP